MHLQEHKGLFFRLDEISSYSLNDQICIPSSNIIDLIWLLRFPNYCPALLHYPLSIPSYKTRFLSHVVGGIVLKPDPVIDLVDPLGH